MSLNLTQAYTQQWIQKGDSVLDVPNVSIDTPKNSDILSPSGNAYQESVRGKLGDKLEYRVGGGVSMTGARVEIKAQSLCSGAGFGNTEVSVEAELKPIAPRGTKPEGGDTLLYIGKGDLQGKLFVAGRHSDREGMLLGSTTPLKYIECLPLQNAEAVKHAWNNPYASYNDVVIVKSVRGKVAKDYGA